MTIAITTSRASYVADGLATPRSVGFPLESTSDLIVKVNGAQQTLNVHYSITGPLSAPILTPLSPFWANGAVVRYRRKTPAKQQYNAQPGVDLKSADLEKQLDRQTMAIQDIDGQVEDFGARALLVPDGQFSAPVPWGAAAGGKVLGYGATGETLVAINPGGADSALRDDLAEETAPLLIGSEDGDLTASLARRAAADIRGWLGGDGEISAVITAMRARGINRGFLAAGNYTVANEYDIGDFHLECSPEAAIALGVGFAGNSMLKSVGTFTQIADLAADVSAAALTINFAAAHGLAVGDQFIIYNPTNGSFNPARTYYRDGEWCQVRNVVDADTVILSRPLNSGYAAATVDIYKASLKRPRITGGLWKPGAKRAFLFTGCTGLLTQEVRFDAACPEVIYTDRCVNFEVNVRDGHNAGSGGDDYGVVSGNSQHGRITGGRIYSRRHAVAQGGGDFICSVPERDVFAVGMRLENDHTAGVLAADLHGNCADCGYWNCDIIGGGSMGGLNPSFRGSRITAAGSNSCLYLDEFKGGRVDLRGVTLTTYAVNVTAGAGIVDFGEVAAYFNANTVVDVDLLLADFVLVAPFLAANETLVRMGNTGSGAKFSPHIRPSSLKTAGNALRILQTSLTSGVAASNGIKIEDVGLLPAGSFYHLASGGHYLNVPHRLPKQRGNYDATTAVSTSVISAVINYPVPYPRKPQARTHLAAQDTATFNHPAALGSNKPVLAAPFQVTESSIRAAIWSDANFTAGNAFRVEWEVEIDEL